MQLWSRWYADLLPHLADCPLPLVERALLRSAQEFFTLSRAWQVNLPVVLVKAGSTSITINTDPEQDLVRVEAAWYDHQTLRLLAIPDMEREIQGDWNLQSGTPTALLQLLPGVASLYPHPNKDAQVGLSMRVSVRPSETASGIPDELFVKYREAMESGALARLMLMPGKSWSNLELSSFHAQNFAQLGAQANVDAARGFQQARIAARPVWV